MGDVQSVPVFSQLASLVLVIAGEEEAARWVQKEFIEKGIIASQVNSLVHAIDGNNEEARRIQNEFLHQMDPYYHPYPFRSRRSVPREEDLLHKATFPVTDTSSLPHLLNDISFQDQTAVMSPNQLVTTIYSIFMILKLISIGHPKSRPYYQEICGQAFPGENLEFCQETLMTKFRKMDADMETGVRPNITVNSLQELMSVLMFEMKNLVGHTNLGKDLLVAICFNYKDQTQRDQCMTNLAATLDKLKAEFDELDRAHVSMKRASISPPSPGSAGRVFMFSDKFLENHVRANLADTYSKIQNRKLTYSEAQAMTRPNVRVNTFVGDDVHRLLENQPGRVLTNPRQRAFVVDTPEVDFVQTVNLPNGDIQVQAGRGAARISVQAVDEFSGPSATAYEMINLEKMANADIRYDYVLMQPN